MSMSWPQRWRDRVVIRAILQARIDLSCKYPDSGEFRCIAGAILTSPEIARDDNTKKAHEAKAHVGLEP